MPRERRRAIPLAEFVRRHDDRALQFLLLILAAASRDVTTGAFDVTLAAETWARMLGLRGAAPASAVSKVLARLIDDRLVKRDIRRRQAHITLLREDGSGEDYSRPKAKYLQLPHAYWIDGWHSKFSLAAKAALLVALSMPQSSSYRSRTHPTSLDSPQTLSRTACTSSATKGCWTVASATRGRRWPRRATHRPKGSSRAQLLEGKANLLRLRQDIPLTDDERAAVEDGVEAMERLLVRLAEVPTPDGGPTPRERGSA